jgi:MFS family permease
VGLVVGGLGRFGYTLVLPSIRDDLGLSYALSGLLATANFAGFLVAAFSGGLLSARLGVRGASVAGLLAMLVGWVASGLAPTYPILLALQIPVGFGTGTVMIATISSLPAWFPLRYRGLVSGLGNGAAGLGILLSGVLVPWLLAQFGPTGWRQVWFVFAGGVGLATVVAAVFLRRRVTTGAQLPAGARRPPAPGIYRNALYWRYASVTLLMGAATGIYGTYFGAYGTQQLGLAPDQVGRTWGLVGLLSIFSGVLWGVLSDRTGRRTALGATLLVQAAANAIVVVSPGPVTLTISAAIAGLTLFGAAAVMTAMMSDVAEPHLLPAVGGLLAIGSGVGQLGGPALAGALADLTQTLAAAYILSGLVSLIGVGAVLALPTLQHRPIGAVG